MYQPGLHTLDLLGVDVDLGVLRAEHVLGQILHLPLLPHVVLLSRKSQTILNMMSLVWKMLTCMQASL